MRVAFYTLGCKVNQYETQALSELFEGRGHIVVPFSEQADCYIVNSCTVTAQGDKKARQMLRRAKAGRPGAAAALTGCYPQAFPGAAAAIAEADIVTGSSNRAELVEAVEEFFASGRRVVRVRPHRAGEAFEALTVGRMEGKTRAFVKIEDGCDRWCAYCIIPAARGPVRSKPLEELGGELAGLSARGHREAVLTGVNLSSYGRDIGSDLGQAVELACSLPGFDRVRLGSLEPDLTGDDLIARLAAQPKFCPQFHLSVQSGCDATLTRMRRRYTTAQYLELLEKLRRAFDLPGITTDLMVGFPGETDGEFAQTLDFLTKAGFAKVHIFPYSPRPGTAAAVMPGQVDAAVKEQRARLATRAAAQTRDAFLASMAGRAEPVLFERSSHPGFQEGHTPNGVHVLLAGGQDLRWQLRQTRITGVEGESCLGELL